MIPAGNPLAGAFGLSFTFGPIQGEVQQATPTDRFSKSGFSGPIQIQLGLAVEGPGSDSSPEAVKVIDTFGCDLVTVM